MKSEEGKLISSKPKWLFFFAFAYKEKRFYTGGSSVFLSAFT
uniref:Uncharacterized protein n=1 Tax=Anguilla anguilla TaxID=7936 RepID=A0A0E9WTS5_ANGAN